MGKSKLIFLTHGVDDRWCYTVSENIHALWIALSFAVDATSVMWCWKYSIFWLLALLIIFLTKIVKFGPRMSSFTASKCVNALYSTWIQLLSEGLCSWRCVYSQCEGIRVVSCESSCASSKRWATVWFCGWHQCFPCFVTVGWVTGRAFGPRKPVPLSYRFSGESKANGNFITVTADLLLIIIIFVCLPHVQFGVSQR